MTRLTASLLAALGSAALLGGAFGFQYIGGMAPCHLCLLQRWPHAAAIALGVLMLALRNTVLARVIPWAGALAALTTAGIGAYHTGVERKWWLGPSTCTSGDVSALSAKDLLAKIQAAPVVQCDQVAWEMFGLSMASWNMLASLALVGVWVYAATRKA
jgi:disulfide bond formation protein DsbB